MSRESDCKTFQSRINIDPELVGKETGNALNFRLEQKPNKINFVNPRNIYLETFLNRCLNHPELTPQLSKIHTKTIQNRSFEGVWAPVAVKVAFQRDFGPSWGRLGAFWGRLGSVLEPF